ncbi:MAG: hypothetical protein JSV05_00435 [Candidatus Bathyarchaeota archaeon]|nr:MAG: hypothetical protein JSV05_00435 [Candidatus Bathyarchaeota archaeon]
MRIDVPIIQKINCAHCGAPIQFKPGEIIATCRYCGFTQVIETGRAFDFEHATFQNNYDGDNIENLVHEWMRTGFTKPGDLARKARIIEKDLVYIPFWVLDINSLTTYKGIFERLTPPVVKEGKIKKRYNWLVLARKATKFPTREFDIPLEGKIPYDFRKIEGYAKILNSEIEQDKAMEKAKQEIEDHHRFLIKQDVDRIMEIHTKFEVGKATYLHAPIWFIIYEYRKKRHRMLIDGSVGIIIKGDIPTAKLGIL